MRFSLLATLPLAGFFLGACASPTPAAAEQEANVAYGIVNTLYADIKQYTGAINTTAASLNAQSTAQDNATAALAFQSAVVSITDAVNLATTQTDLLGLKRAVLSTRQAETNALASLVENLLLEVGGALNNIISTLGLTSLLGTLTPLVGSLSGLLLSLENVVDNLLAVVQQLVDGLLTGLSLGLAGLTL